MKKKVLLSVLLGIVMVCITGCGTNQFKEKKEYGEGYEILKCDVEKSEDDSEELLKTYLQIVRDVKTEAVVETSLNMDFDYSDVLKDDKNGFAKKTINSSLNLMCDTFEKEGFLDCYYYSDDTMYSISLEMDINTISDDSKNYVSNVSSFDDIKDMLEKQDTLKVSNCVVE